MDSYLVRVVRYLLILVNFIWGARAAAGNIKLTPIQTQFLTEVKTRVLNQLQSLDAETLEWGNCFSHKACSPEIQSMLSDAEAAILQQNTNYRLMVGMTQIALLKAGARRVSLPQLAHPIQITDDASDSEPSEWQEILEIDKQDRQTMEAQFEKGWSQGVLKGLDRNQAYDLFINDAVATQAQIYSNQAWADVENNPLLLFLDSRHPSELDIANAFAKYHKMIDEQLKTDSDPKQTPLVGFISFDPVVSDVLEQSPQYKSVLQSINELLTPHQKISDAYDYLEKSHLKALAASMKLVSAFATAEPKIFDKTYSLFLQNRFMAMTAVMSLCSYIALSQPEAWGLAAICAAGGVTTTLFGIERSFNNYNENFDQWIMKIKSADQMKSAETQMLWTILSSTMMLPGLGRLAGRFEFTSVKSTMKSAILGLKGHFSSSERLAQFGAGFVKHHTKGVIGDVKGLVYSRSAQDLLNSGDSPEETQASDSQVPYITYAMAVANLAAEN